MENKRGQFFALYLVFITLFMMGVVAGLYFVQYKNVQAALVSPMEVLKARDGLELFEMRETELIKSSLDEAGGDFCSEGFAKDFERTFIDRALADGLVRDFIFSNLTLNGRKVEEDARLADREFFENVLYREGLTECENGQRFFSRAKVGKSYVLKAKGNGGLRISFPVGFNFEFERKYKITKNSGGFEVKAV